MLPINVYPYLNLTDFNLDYITKSIEELRFEVTNFVSLNAIKYANPIQWDITRQYEKNTVVIDPVTGTAYISVAPVPMGVALTNTDYWCVVFDLGSFVTRAAQNFTDHWESDTTTTATFSLSTGEWLVWGDVLYKALTNITAGDAYVVGGNIDHFTIEDIYNAYLNTIANILAIVGDLVDLNTSDKTSIVNAINSVVADLAQEVIDRGNADTALHNEIVDAVNEIERKPRANEIALDYLSTTMSYDSRYPAYSGNRYNAVGQGMCINDDGNLIMVRVDESDRDNYGIIEVYNVAGVLLSSSPSLEVGHGNTITYRDGYYYIGWSLSASGGIQTPSYNVSKIKKDFSTTEIITAPIIVPSLSYDPTDDIFYCFNGGKLYKLNIALDTVLEVLQCEEPPAYNTTLHPNMERQNGVYYNGFWVQLYVFPPLMVWYDAKTGEVVKQYNFPRRLIYNGFSTYEPESVVYDPDTDYFYSNFFARCGAGDISSNVFCRWSPFKNEFMNDDRYYARNGVGLDLYVDPTINDNAFMNGKSDTPFKYIQNALDYCHHFTDTTFQIHVRTANVDLGAINVTNTNNFNILLDTGYTADTSATVPSIRILKCSNVGVFSMNTDSVEVQNSTDVQFANISVTNKMYLNRVFDADLQTSSCDELELRNSGVSIYSMTYNTLTKTGVVVFKHENISYFDGGFENVTTPVPAGSYIDVPITYNRPSNGTPFIVATLHLNSSNMNTLTKMHIVSQSRTATGATLRIANEDTTDHTCGLNWLAFTKLS